MTLKGERLKKAREKRGLSQTQLAEKLGYKSRSSVNKMEVGDRDIPDKKIEELARLLDVTPAFLKGWEDDPRIIMKIKPIDLFVGPGKLVEVSKKKTQEDAIRFVTGNTYNIPVYESVSAGFGSYANDYVIDYTPIFIASPEEAQNTIVVVVSGNSMYPKIEDGDQIQVLRQDWAENGDIAVVLVDSEEAVVKKYYCDREKETVELISINPEYAPRVFKGREIEQIRVLGVVKRIIKDV